MRTPPPPTVTCRPAALAAHYERAGYDVLATTDHWHITEAASTERLIVLPSVELNCVLPGARDGHVLGFGVRATPDELRELAAGYSNLAETGAWITGHGGVAYLAHPYWTGVTPGTLELPDGVVGIEVFNAGCELEIGRGLVAVHWDELLEARSPSARRWQPTTRTIRASTPDMPRPGCASPSGQRKRCSGRSQTGAFYSSAGPLLHEVRRRR